MIYFSFFFSLLNGFNIKYSFGNSFFFFFFIFLLNFCFCLIFIYRSLLQSFRKRQFNFGLLFKYTQYIRHGVNSNHHSNYALFFFYLNIHFTIFHIILFVSHYSLTFSIQQINGKKGKKTNYLFIVFFFLVLCV